MEGVVCKTITPPWANQITQTKSACTWNWIVHLRSNLQVDFPTVTQYSMNKHLLPEVVDHRNGTSRIIPADLAFLYTTSFCISRMLEFLPPWLIDWNHHISESGQKTLAFLLVTLVLLLMTRPLVPLCLLKPSNFILVIFPISIEE